MTQPLSHTCNGRGIERSNFGQLADGRKVDAYRIVNATGIEMIVISYGGIIASLRTPDREGCYDDIVLGFDALDYYLSKTYREANPYFGALIGRYGNRIAHGRFSLNSKTFTLATNDGQHHLHGGEHGFDQALWQMQPFDNEAGLGVTLSYSSADGEEGYPGRLNAQVTYTLTDADELVIDYQATTTRTTPVNLTQHSYFNLKGEGNGSILDHCLKINADFFIPADTGLIPLGEIRSVAGTPFDFTRPTAIGERIGQNNSQLRGLG
ncbi:galactose mutarotase, partial [Halomonas sp. BBD48]|nr:galactose mutarotase [Halomonas sp. BBD48]